MINIEMIGMKRVQSFLNGVENGTERAVTVGINKTLTKLKTMAKKRVTEEYAIKSGEIEKTLSIRKANFSTLSGTLYSKSPAIALHKFLKSKKKSNLTVVIKKKEGAKSVNGLSKYNGRPFLATMKNGHSGIFQRKGKRPYPIKELYSLSIPQMLGHESMKEYVEAEGGALLENLVMKEVSRILKGYL